MDLRRYLVTEMKKLVLLGLSICLTQANAFTPNKDIELTPCEQIVAIKALLMTATVECGYSRYNDELNSDASVCLRGELNGDHGMGMLLLGNMKFNQYVEEQGKNSTCKYLLKKFPEDVGE